MLSESDRHWLEDKFNEAWRRITTLEDATFGNGQEGLKTEVTIIKEYIKEQRAAKSFRLVLWSGSILAGVGGIINLVLYIVRIQ